MRKVWTINQIREAWKDYSTKRVLRIQRNGKWEIEYIKNGLPTNITGTRAEVVSLKDVYSFPQYLQENYA